MNPKLTVFLDATALKSSSCMRKLTFKIAEGYTPLVKDYKMEYGSAGHLFIAHWYKTKDVNTAVGIALKYYLDPAIVIPDRDFRTPVHLGITLNSYAQQYHNDVFEPSRGIDGELLVEQRFSLPFYEDDFLRVVLFGVIDALGTYGGEHVYLDHKFTSAYNIDEYFRLYDLSVQMLMYKYGIVWLAEKHQETFGMFRGAKCVIDGIFINKVGARFDRSGLIDITDTQLEEFKKLLMGVCGRLSYALENNDFPKEGILNGACEGNFGYPCEFFGVCSSDSSSAKELLDSNFYKRDYDPSIFDR